MNKELIRLKSVIDFEIQAAKTNGFAPSIKNLQVFYERIGDNISENLTKGFDTVSKLKPGSITSTIGNTPYMALGPTEIYKPRGCMVTLLTYGEVLLAQATQVVDLEQRLLSPFHAWVATVLANPKQLDKLQSLKGIEFVKVGELRENLTKIVNLSSDQTMGRYDELLDRNNDWSEVVAINNRLATMVTKKAIANINGKVDSLKNISNSLIHSIENDPNFTATPSSVEKLSTLMHQLGLEIEYYALIMHLVNAYNAMLENNVERLKEIIRE